MGKRALIAGGAGFIGSNLTDLLLSRGYEITVVDSLVTGRIANLSGVIKHIKFIESSIFADTDLGGPYDEIYNLASPASPIDFGKMPVYILDTAAIGHKKLLQLGQKWNAKVLFASSSEIYGEAEVHPQVESYFGNVNTIGPRGCYDEAKRYGEALSQAYLREHRVDTRIVRIFNTYGPRMRPNDGRIVPNFFIQGLQKQALSVYGDGSQTRSFCFVSDMAEGIFKLMQSSETDPVNIGNPIERTVLDIAARVNKLTANPTPIRYLPLPQNDPLKRKPNISRAQETLMWSPTVDLDTGLQKCFEYFSRELELAGGNIHAPTMS